MTWRAQTWNYKGELHLAQIEQHPFGRTILQIPQLVKREIKDGECIEEPTLKLRWQEGQEIMDALYACGYRPTDAKPQGETIKAMSYHLEDLRRLVFKKEYAK